MSVPLFTWPDPAHYKDAPSWKHSDFHMAQHAAAKKRLSKNTFSLKHDVLHAYMLANKENHAFCQNLSCNLMLDVRFMKSRKYSLQWQETHLGNEMSVLYPRNEIFILFGFTDLHLSSRHLKNFLKMHPELVDLPSPRGYAYLCLQDRPVNMHVHTINIQEWLIFHWTVIISLYTLSQLDFPLLFLQLKHRWNRKNSESRRGYVRDK